MADNLKVQMYETQAMLIERERELQEARRENQQLRWDYTLGAVFFVVFAWFLGNFHQWSIYFFPIIIGGFFLLVGAKSSKKWLLIATLFIFILYLSGKGETIDGIRQHLETKIETLQRGIDEQSGEIENLRAGQLENAALSQLENALQEINRLRQLNEHFETEIESLQRRTDEQSEEIENLRAGQLEKAALVDKANEEAKKMMENVSSELGFHSSALILGGFQDYITDSIYIFDSKENKWRMCKQKLPFEMVQHGSAILNGKIYIMGGHDNPKESLASCYKLGENGEWTKMAEMNEKRGGIEHSTIVFDSEIWVIGGWRGSVTLKTVEKYNPQTNIWTKMPNLNFERCASSASIIGGKIFVYGGWSWGATPKTVEVYDPAKNRWEIFCDIPLELALHCSIVEGTNLIIIGGVKSDKTPSDEVWKIDVLDPKKEWIKMPSLKQRRYKHGAVKLSNGIMVFGGEVGTKDQIDSVEIFDGISWTEGPKLPEKHSGFSSIPLSIETEEQLLLQILPAFLETKRMVENMSVQLENVSSELGFHSSALVLGGYHDSKTDSIYIFDSKENKWRTCKQKFPFEVAYHGSAILNGKIYFMGGCSNNLEELLANCYKLGENGEWTKMADMNEKRGAISQSTIVFGSEIWVIGGWGENGILKTVEKYNPQTNIWTKMPNLNFKRSSSSASIISGKIFVFGGWNGKALKSVEVYDPAMNKWEIFCDMPLKLAAHCSIVEGTNLIIIGGRKSDRTTSDEVWKIDVFDPSKEWIKMPSLNQKRFHHGAVKLSNGIMVFGGEVGKKAQIDSVEIFDGTSWTEGPKLPEKHKAFSSIPLSIETEKQLLLQILPAFLETKRMVENVSSELEFHSSALVLGGFHDSKTDSIYMFDSKENKWRTCKQKLPFKVAYHGSAILNGKIYFMGGHNSLTKPLASCYKLGESGEWTKMAEMNEKRNGISQSTIVFGSEIWVIGGWYRGFTLETVEKYNPQTNIWTEMPNLNFERGASSASIIGEKIFVSGGWDNMALKSVEVYDPTKNKWEIFCDMPLELGWHCSIVEGTNLIIIGGVKPDGNPSDEVWKIDVFDPKKEWIKMPSLKQGRYNHGAVKLSNGIMVFGGSIDNTTRIDSVEIFDGTSWTEGPKLPEKRGVFSSISLSIKTETQLLLQLC